MTGSLASDARRLRVYIEYGSGRTRVHISDIMDKTKNEGISVVLAKATRSGASTDWWWGDPANSKRLPSAPDPLIPIYVNVVIKGDLGEQYGSLLIIRINKDFMKDAQ